MFSKKYKLFSATLFFSLLSTPILKAQVQQSITSETLTYTEQEAVQSEKGADVPSLLKGIWYNSNRYIIFDSSYSEDKTNIPQMVLRTYYTWYDDRAAESKEYTALTGTKTTNTSSEENSNDKTISETARDRNNTVAENAEEIKIKFVPLIQEVLPQSYNMNVSLSDGSEMYSESEPTGAWDLEIQYPKSKIIYHVPVAVIGNNLYLNFTVKSVSYGNSSTGTVSYSASDGSYFEGQDNSIIESNSSEENSLFSSEMTGFWQDYGNASGILISPPVTNTELLSFLITSSSVYHIRYWQTDMDYDENAVATFSDGSNSYTVKKHLSVGGKIFTCVNGRGTKIRNIEKSSSLPEDYKFNSVLIQKTEIDENGDNVTTVKKIATICALGKPYLTLSDGKKTIEQLVVEANKRHKPLPPPVFPPSGLDFHWNIIKDLNKYNRVLSLGKE